MSFFFGTRFPILFISQILKMPGTKYGSENFEKCGTLQHGPHQVDHLCQAIRKPIQKRHQTPRQKEKPSGHKAAQREKGKWPAAHPPTLRTHRSLTFAFQRFFDLFGASEYDNPTQLGQPRCLVKVSSFNSSGIERCGLLKLAPAVDFFAKF